MASSSTARSRSAAAAALLGLVIALLASAPPAPVAAQGADQAIAIVKDDELPSNAELAVRLSESTPLPDVTEVVISRDDEFADALASGLLQADSPLLMVPSTGPIPTRVLEEIQRTGASTATILGGDQAVDPGVEQQLAAAGLDVQRRQGSSRFETAIDIAASDGADATTAILARAFPADPANPTQGFADALAAGALAAENRFPILLSQTEALTGVTRDYLGSSDIERVLIVGGTAAISAGVEQELQGLGLSTERIAGDSRAETAVEIAKQNGADSAADVARVVLVDGTSPNGFAGGFAAAAHAAFHDAPILLADGPRLPPATEAFLQPGAAFAQQGDPLAVTCVVHPLACDGGREALGLVDFPLLEVEPPINSAVSPGQTVALTLGPAAEGAGVPVTVKGSCLDGQVDLVTDGSGTARYTLSSALGGGNGFCSVEIIYSAVSRDEGIEGISDTIQQGFSYATDPELGRPPGIDLASDVLTYGTAVTSTPMYVSDEISCTGPAGDIARQSSAYEARYLREDFSTESFSLTSVPLTALPGDACTARIQVPDGAGRVLWGLYSWADNSLRNPLLLGAGTTAAFDFDDLGTDVTDVNVVWIIEVNDPAIGPTPPPAVQDGGATGRIFNPEGLDVVCDGVLVDRGFSAPGPGAACQVASPVPGLDVLVVAPGRPIQPAPQAQFALPPTSEVVGVYTVNTGGVAGAGSCADAEELPYSFLTPGFTTPSSPVAYHTFFGFEGEAIRFRADNAYGDFEFGLDPVLTVIGPDGQEVGFNDDGDSGLNSRVDVVLPVEGEYCLQVTGFGDSTGDYLVAADPAPQVTEFGELTASQPTQTLPLQLGADDVVIIEMRAPGFASTDPLLSVLAPDGSEVAFDDDGGGYPNSRIELESPGAGTYTLVLGAYADFVGPYQLELSYLPVGQAFASTAR